jgi:hypothetical protein
MLITDQYNIFLFWNSGFENAPKLIQECARSWKSHHEGSNWKLHLIHEENLSEYLNLMPEVDVDALEHHLARMSRKERCGDIVKFTDLLRLTLLDNFGGVWVDATVFCQRPLDQWVDLMSSNLMAPRSSEFNRRHEAWFLVNLHQHPYLTDWKIAFRELIVSGSDFCDDWKFKKTHLFYWLLFIGRRSPLIAALIWNSWFVKKVMKKQPYFSINYCAEYILQKKHSYLSRTGDLFLNLDPQRCCPNRSILENPDAWDFSDQGIVKLNHKWTYDKLLLKLKRYQESDSAKSK